jgi:hypothetical protein
MDLQSHRPQGFTSAGDQYLPRIARDLKRFLRYAQDELAYDALHLPAKELGVLAGVLVEFMEDIH